MIIRTRVLPRRILAYSLVGSALALMAMPSARANPGPVLTRSPSTLAFGNQQVDTTSVAQFVSVQNTGDATLTIGSLTLGGSNPTQFALESDTCSSASLPPGGSCSFSVAFGPTSTGAKTAGVSIPSNDPSSPHTVALSGTGVNPGLTRSPSSLSFGNQQIQTTSVVQYVYVQNTGTGNGPLDVGTVSIGGTGAPHFSIQSDPCSGTTLGPGESCFIGVQFGPTATGAKIASLSIPSNAPSSPDPVSLSGTGVDANLTRSPTFLAFGNQQVNTSSLDQYVSIQNTGTGNGPLAVGALTISGAGASHFGFVADTCSGVSLAPGSSCYFSVAFSPTGTGLKNASVSIPSNAPSNPDTVALSGTGVNPSISRSPSSIAFGNQQIGTSSLADFIFVSNNGTGNGPLSIGTVTLIGAHPGQFTIDSDTCSGSMLAPGGNCFISVFFAPTSTGAKSATVSIPSDAPSSPDPVALTGTGVLGLSVSPSNVNFGELEAGETSPVRTITVANTGNDIIPIQDTSLSGANAGDFAIVFDDCTGVFLYPQQSCSYQVTFTPQATGARAATLTITSGVGSFPVGLTGIGIDTTGPTNEWVTTSNSIRVSTVQNVNGRSSDPSGIDSVSVRFTDVLGSATVVEATLGPCTSGNRSCDWSVVVPLLLPGPYTAAILSDDTLGNASEGPDITVIVI